MQLICDGKEVAQLTSAITRLQKMKGLLGTRSFEGAMLFDNVNAVHTAFMKYSIDVALIDERLTVLKTQTLQPFRASARVANAKHVIEAKAGSFERWSLQRGSKLEFK